MGHLERAPALTGSTCGEEPPFPGAARPFLKWAGGKRQLLPSIRACYPDHFGAYHEPFVGSGAVFFDLCRTGRLTGHRPFLADRNADLVGCYRMVRDRVDEVIAHLEGLTEERLTDPTQHYYRVRDDRFNPARLEIFDGAGPDSGRYTPTLAAELLYLNRTGFNGLFRLNSRGVFNVPIGRYANPRICDRTNLLAASAVLRMTGARITHARFESILHDAQAGDLVYVDPPYAPLTRTAVFTSYTAARFSSDDQRRLQQVVVELARRGAWVILSNSTAPEIAALYDGNPEAEAAGLRAHTVSAKRAINAKPSARGPVLEYLITNVPVSDVRPVTEDSR